MLLPHLTAGRAAGGYSLVLPMRGCCLLVFAAIRKVAFTSTSQSFASFVEDEPPLARSPSWIQRCHRSAVDRRPERPLMPLIVCLVPAAGAPLDVCHRS